jgi:hypothetical protein
MTKDQLQAIRDASPFSPFTIHLADGRSLRVLHRDFISVSPGGRTIIVYHTGEAFSVIDKLLITELAVDDRTVQSNGHST